MRHGGRRDRHRGRRHLRATLEAIYPIGPVADGTALNITLMSDMDRLHVGLAADRDAVPDLDGLAVDQLRRTPRHGDDRRPTPGWHGAKNE